MCRRLPAIISRAWLWLWYHYITRLLILLGMPVIPVVAIAYLAFGPGETLKIIAAVTYVITIILAIIYKDYFDAGRIGKYVNRKDLNK